MNECDECREGQRCWEELSVIMNGGGSGAADLAGIESAKISVNRGRTYGPHHAPGCAKRARTRGEIFWPGVYFDR